MAIFTIGHSDRDLGQLLELLQDFGIARLIDIRTVPRSRHTPQFNSDRLRDFLSAHAIAYEHEPRLGGFRKPKRDSSNTGWENSAFRGYADHMQTDEFEQGLRGVISRARREKVAVMCAEAVPWRCHRSLLADALAIQGIRVVHILARHRGQEHEVTPWASLEDGRLSYPSGRPGRAA